MRSSPLARNWGAVRCRRGATAQLMPPSSSCRADGPATSGSRRAPAEGAPAADPAPLVSACTCSTAACSTSRSPAASRARVCSLSASVPNYEIAIVGHGGRFLGRRPVRAAARAGCRASRARFRISSPADTPRLPSLIGFGESPSSLDQARKWSDFDSAPSSRMPRNLISRQSSIVALLGVMGPTFRRPLPSPACPASSPGTSRGRRAGAGAACCAQMRAEWRAARPPSGAHCGCASMRRPP